MPPKSSKRERPKNFLGRPHHEVVRSRPTTPEPSGARQSNADPFTYTSSSSAIVPPSASQSDSSILTSGPDILAPGLLATPAIDVAPTDLREATIATQTLQVSGTPQNVNIYGTCLAPQQLQSQQVTNISYAPPRASLAPAQPFSAIIAQPQQSSHSRQQEDPSTSCAAPQTPKASSSTTHSRTKGSTALKSALRKLGKVTNAVPPLGSVVDLLADCVDAVSITGEGCEDYEVLAETIAASVEVLEKHLELSDLVEITEPVMTIVDKLKEQADYLSVKQRRAGIRRLIDVQQDTDDVMKCYRRLNTLFQQLQNNAILHIWRLAKKNWNAADETLAVAKNAILDKLDPATAARYDSIAASQLGRGACTPNTRRLVLQGLQNWANDPNGSKVYWMNGMAGTGKTTIAYSFCSELESAEQLAASFFCTRQLPECQDVSRIVPMIAYQLAHFCRPVKEVLCRRLSSDPTVSIRSLTTQFEKLISTPLRDVRDRLPTILPIVVIDALDECSSRGDAVLFLSALLRCAGDLPVKFFVTCRPDSVLLGKLSAGGSIAHSLLHLHDIEESL
ncbi:hypothetical protein FRC07_005498, partial [Ceratobasidium sp. 392]